MWKDAIVANPVDRQTLTILEQQSSYIPTFVYSVIEQTIPGKVYSDSRGNYLVETKNGLYYVSGDENDSMFLNFLRELYVNRKKKGLRTTMFSPSPEWNQVLKEFPKVKERKRYTYSWLGGHVQNSLKSKYQWQKIDQETMSNSLFFNEDYYREYWGSIERFLQSGIGYCIIDQGEVISECTSIFANSRFSEIDIATVDGYQGKGLAKDLAQTFIQECLANQVVPRWECDVDHKVSNKLAGKLGFGNPVAYSVFT